jgi:transposase-like protein
MRPISFKRHRFPPEIIRHAIWLYARFTLSFRDVEELLAERGIDASYETAAVVPEVRAVDRGEYPPFATAAERSLAPR